MTMGPPTVRPSDTVLAFSFLGMLAGTVIAAVTAGSVVVLIVGFIVTIGIQRVLIGGTKL